MATKRSRSSSSSALTKRSRQGDRRKVLTRKTWPKATTRSYLKFYDPFPAIMRGRLRYATNIQLSATAGIPGYHLFRCNSIFDPDYSGVGHQPYGHDTYQTLYNHYNVLSATITITNATGVNGVLGVTLTDDTTVETNYDTIKERKGTNMMACIASSQNQTLTSKYKIAYTGDPSRNISLFGGNPTDLMYWQVWLTAPLSTSNDNANCLVTITYDCEFSELKDLGQS